MASTGVRSARFWALARRQGTPTASDKALDGDMILAGQATTFDERDVVIATTNVGHLARWVPAEEWRNLSARV